ncbi:MAG: YfiT family bacillithiol transferase [Pyrinomonadaceae bacterium]
MTEDLRYPIGDFDRNFDTSLKARQDRMAVIADLPSKISSAVSGLNDIQIETHYRAGGWTVRQTVHHIADSHSNALIRFKLALTEYVPPTIKPYFEDRWAELGDSKLPVEVSIQMLGAIHQRWSALLDSMNETDFQRSFIHPETGVWTLEGALALYAWHSRHHTAHITSLRERKAW